MYRPLRPNRPRPVHFMGQAPRERSVMPVLLAGGLVFGLGLGFIGYLSHRTARMRQRSRAVRRWG